MPIYTFVANHPLSLLHSAPRNRCDRLHGPNDSALSSRLGSFLRGPSRRVMKFRRPQPPKQFTQRSRTSVAHLDSLNLRCRIRMLAAHPDEQPERP